MVFSEFTFEQVEKRVYSSSRRSAETPLKKLDVRIPSTGGTLADAEVLSRREIHQQCIRAKEMLEKQQERESLEVRELAGRPLCHSR